MANAISGSAVPMDEPTSKGVSGHISWIDSLKGALIFLVVIGHIMLPAQGVAPAVRVTFELVYLFHMPLFVFVSGFLAKHTIDGRGRLRVERIFTYFVAGLVFNMAVRIADGSSVSPLHLLMFPSAPWYLVSMAWWMMLVPFFSRLRPIWGGALGFLVSLGVAMLSDQTDFFALSRTAHFLPYFMVGYYVSRPALERLRCPRVRVVLALVAIAVLAAFFLFEGDLRPILFFMYGASDCTLPISRAVPAYVLVSSLGIVLALGLVAIVPSHCRPLEVLGKRTFPVYVFHRLLKGPLVSLGFYNVLPNLGSQVSLALLVVLSLFVCLACSWRGFACATDRLMGVRWRFLLREDA